MRETAPTLETPRLRLRPWRDDDLPEFARISADPRVMENMPQCLSRAESDAAAGRIRDRMAELGYGLWAVEVRGGPAFAGFVGLAVPKYETPFSPFVEIAWRLAAEHWGRGYAAEGARAALAFGFTQLGLAEIVSFTVPANVRSWRVMERIGMKRDLAGDFDHPLLPPESPLRRHVLYRLRRSDWAAAAERPAAG